MVKPKLGSTVFNLSGCSQMYWMLLDYAYLRRHSARNEGERREVDGWLSGSTVPLTAKSAFGFERRHER